MNNFDNINYILNSDAGYIIEDISTPLNKKWVDNRFELFKHSVELAKNKDTNFYTKLVETISPYIAKLYNAKINQHLAIILDENGKIIPGNMICINEADMPYIMRANNTLSKKIFEYICNILENYKDVKIDNETLKRLLNRNPMLISHYAEVSYSYRDLNYKKLVNIINKNRILEKSNISIDDVYQILYDTCQLNNKDVFCGLVTKDEFSKNHKKIIEILNNCNPKAISEITNIIIGNFDKNFDRLRFVKNRTIDEFPEELIIELLVSDTTKADYEFIHQILTDPKIQINYEKGYSCFTGTTNLKSLIAFSRNPLIIKDLLGNKQNVEDCYFSGDYDVSRIELFCLYAIIGDYEKAIDIFNKSYVCLEDFEEYPIEGGYDYEESYVDPLAGFVKDICMSFNIHETDYLTRKFTINSILNNKRIKYINLKVLPVIKKILPSEDFNELVDNLVLRRNSGQLGFITEDYSNGTPYPDVRLASDAEIQGYLSSIIKKGNNKVLCLKPIKQDN